MQYMHTLGLPSSPGTRLLCVLWNSVLCHDKAFALALSGVGTLLRGEEQGEHEAQEAPSLPDSMYSVTVAGS